MTMTKKRPWPMFIGLSTTAVLLVGGILVRGHVETQQAGDDGRPTDTSATPVRVARIERRLINAQARFHGFLAPFTQLTIAAGVPGEIVRRDVEISDAVATAQVLFQIDDTVRKIEHDEAIAGRERAESECQLAEANWKRITALSDQISSSMERIEAETRLRSANADKRRAEAGVQRAAAMLERTTVKSPINGVVSNIYSRRGEYVQPGQPLAEVIEIERLKLLALIEDRDVVWVEVGQPVELMTRTLPGEQFTGTVLRIYPQPLPDSRKFEVEIELSNPQHRLRPGFFMLGTISRPANEATAGSYALVLPREAVVERYGQHFCYVLRPTDDERTPNAIYEAQRTALEILPILSDPRSYEVVSGVEEGSLVVTKGQQHLSERSAVRITD